MPSSERASDLFSGISVSTAARRPLQNLWIDGDGDLDAPGEPPGRSLGTAR